MKYTTDEILGKIPVSKAIVKLALPTIMAMIIMAVYNFVDTLFIGFLNSDESLSAVSVAFPIMTLMGAVGQVLGAGSAAVIGRAFGSSNDNFASKTATTIIYTAFISAIVFMSVGLIFSESIFKIFGATERIMPYAKQYGTWMFVGALFSIPNQVFNNIARAETKSILSMTALMTGAILNVILDPIFMFKFDIGSISVGLGMGIEGASMATTLAQFISFLFISQFFFRGKSRVKITPLNFKPSKEIYALTLKSGAPVGATQLLSAFAVSITNIVAVQVAPNAISGDNIIASYGIVLKILSITQFVLIGFFQGYQPISSYAYGSKNKERFFLAYKYAKTAGFVYSVFATIVIQIFAQNCIEIFSNNEDIIYYGTMFLRLNNMFFPLTSFVFLVMLTSQATGNGKLGATMALTRQGILYIPALIIFPLIFDYTGIFYAQAAADCVTWVIAIIMFKKYKKTLELYLEN